MSSADDQRGALDAELASAADGIEGAVASEASRPEQRRAFVLAFLFATARAAASGAERGGGDDSTQITFLRLSLTEVARQIDGLTSGQLAAIRRHAESDYERADVRRQIAAVATEQRAGQDGKDLSAWSDAFARYATWIRGTDARVPAADVEADLAGKVRALCARLDIGTVETLHLAWLASLALAGSTPGAGFHDTGLASMSRRYHEAAKFFPDTMHRQLPRMDAERPRKEPEPERMLPLGPPGPEFSRVTLTDCLANRRSARGHYGGEITRPALATLLHAAAGSRSGGEDAGQHRRTYPSAGSWFAARLLLLPVRVEAVPAGMYEYLPEQHVLYRRGPTATVAELRETSPYLAPGFPQGVDAESVPLWLFVAGDITSLSQRYGLRAYRFLLMEAGHLAQNLLLAATGLGLATLSIGSFYDDMLAQTLGMDGVNDAPFYIIPVGFTTRQDNRLEMERGPS